MKIIIKNKSNNKRAGIIRSKNIGTACYIDLNYHNNPKLFIKIQKLLAKDYDLTYFSEGTKQKRSKLIISKVKNYKCKSIKVSQSRNLNKIKKAERGNKENECKS